MATWCADNLRDLTGWKSSGLEMTNTTDECAKLLDGSLRQLVSWRDCDQLGGLLKTLENLKNAGTNSPLTVSFLVCLDAMGLDKSTFSNPTFKAEVEAAEEMASRIGNDREKKHLKAAALWARGYLPEAQSTWEEILKEYPNDLMAVKFAHDSYFFAGDQQGKKVSVERVIEKWRDDEPCKSYLHGMYAFGLEECGEYDKAEKESLKALSIRREDCWATHARAHVLEMEGRTKEGKEFMESTREDWEPGWPLACHNHWHNSLYYIEDGDYETPLTMFDEQVGPRSTASQGMLDLVDAASLLWRLELEGVHVGKERWRSLPSLKDHLHDHVISFNDAHFAFILKRGGYDEEEKQLHESLRSFVSSGPRNNNHRVAQLVGLPLYEALTAFADGDYDKTVQLLMPVREHVHLIAGSHAQNDVFRQTLIHACLRSGRDEHREYAKVLLAEREEKKSHSGIARRLREKLSAM